jgi:quinol monooxygenase YgiN
LLEGTAAIGRHGMSDPLVVIDSSEIREGKLEELKTALAELADFVERNEAAPLAYHVYFDEDGTRMTVLQIHPDSESMELHMNVAAPLFGRFTELVDLSRVDFYGTPNEVVLDATRRKAQLLGNAAVVVNELHAGFTRFEVSAPGDRARAGR